MVFLGTVFLIVGGVGLIWFGIPAVIGLSELIASRTTGHPMPAGRADAIKDSLYKLSGSVVFAAAGFSLLYFSSQ